MGIQLYSKLQTGDFPDFDAILKAVKSMCLIPALPKFYLRQSCLSVPAVCPESDACLVVVAVFKTVAPTLCAGG